MEIGKLEERCFNINSNTGSVKQIETINDTLFGIALDVSSSKREYKFISNVTNLKLKNYKSIFPDVYNMLLCTTKAMYIKNFMSYIQMKYVMECCQ